LRRVSTKIATARKPPSFTTELRTSTCSGTNFADPYSYSRPDASMRRLVLRALLGNDGSREMRFERVTAG
jgi:hypothetical protein